MTVGLAREYKRLFLIHPPIHVIGSGYDCRLGPRIHTSFSDLSADTRHRLVQFLSFGILLEASAAHGRDDKRHSPQAQKVGGPTGRHNPSRQRELPVRQ
jgi:hypothetical protein